jgi:neopullulanase
LGARGDAAGPSSGGHPRRNTGVTTTEPQTIGVLTPEWVRDAVFYQIFPDRFARSLRTVAPGPLEDWDTPPTVHGFKGGNLLGVLEHLDHLERLGVNAIYFNPVFASASNHRYHTYDYFQVDPLLGGNAALRELLDACHARGIRVVLDGVFNHASRGFWPFNHVLECGKDSPYRNWFHFHEADLDAGRPIRAYPLDPATVDVSNLEDMSLLGTRSLETNGYLAWWDLPALPKLNTDNPHVREYLLQVGEYWMDFGADGWRLDVAEEVPQTFWRSFRERVRAANPQAYIVAEIWGERPEVLRGDTFDALMNYPLGAAITSFVGAWRLDRRILAQHWTLNAAIQELDADTFLLRLTRSMSLYDPAVTAVQMNLLDSHDTPRFLTMVGGDTASLRLAMLIEMTLAGAPTIYYGDEIGMTGELDPGSRASFPWDHPERWDRDLLAYLSGLIDLRRREPVLRRGAFRPVVAAGRTVAYLRTLDSPAALVVVNAADEPHPGLRLDVPELDGRTLVVRATGSTAEPESSGAVRYAVRDGSVELDVPARDGLILLAE